jgi:hypothetical protein
LAGTTRKTTLQEDRNTPDHLPIMPHFIQNSVIYLDKQNCNFVFAVVNLSCDKKTIDQEAKLRHPP